MSKCLVCHIELESQNRTEYHLGCAKKLFGSSNPPRMDIALSDIEKLASETVTRSITVPGVQPKLSMHIESQNGASRFTIVGLWGGFVLKPPVPEYPGLPENEDVIMTLADLAGIETVPHGLIRFASGELGYITRRIDRENTRKSHMEDFCQLSGRLTHEKYNGSLESASKVISRYATNEGYDMIRLFSSVVFSFLTGNADMHLKKYSLIKLPNGDIALSPAYDLVSTAIAMPLDKEESALTINGKKNRFERIDFLSLASYMGIPAKSAENEIHRFSKWKTKSTGIIESSFFDDEDKLRLTTLIDERSERLGI